MKLHIKVGIQIQKPVDEIFNAIIDPTHMSQYFIAKSSGRMEEGKSLIWNFPEFDGDAPVRVGKITKNELITFYWEINEIEVEVVIQLEPRADGSTVVRITEKEMDNDEAGINWLKGNTEGWSNFLACLKAYLEYGINLRRGAFGFRF
ncbi:MAG: SRPBCC domain-containing protein [Saprospiraceae bacterium]|nr:SRPBCC domain-containing protein [Saprospiraceae bacterium]